MKLKINRFAPDPMDEYYPTYTYTYNSKGYVTSVEVAVETEYDITSVELSRGATLWGDLVDVTSDWTFYNDGTAVKQIFSEPCHSTFIINFENVGSSGYVVVDTSDDFTPDSEKYPVIVNEDIKISNSNTKFKNIANLVENYFNELYPVGSIYKSTSSNVPFNKGTWSLVISGYDRISIGSQVIWPGSSGSTLVSKTDVLGAYDYTLINGLSANVTLPSGYHWEYKLSFQGRTGGNTQIQMWINNISTNTVQTWSGDTFRVIGSSAFFKESDITLETAYGYSRAGTNLKYAITGSANAWQIWNATIHMYMVSNNYYYTWKRTA